MTGVVDAASPNHTEKYDTACKYEELAATDNTVFVDLGRHTIQATECGDYILRPFVNNPRAVGVEQRAQHRRQCSDQYEVRTFMEKRRGLLGGRKPTYTHQDE